MNYLSVRVAATTAADAARVETLREKTYALLKTRFVRVRLYFDKSVRTGRARFFQKIATTTGKTVAKKTPSEINVRRRVPVHYYYETSRLTGNNARKLLYTDIRPKRSRWKSGGVFTGGVGGREFFQDYKFTTASIITFHTIYKLI